MIDAHELSPLAPVWLDGGGEMGALMREMDWSQTPLGPADSWSTSLKMMTRFMLANRFPLLLWWGPQFYQLYNDAYRPILGAKHPQFLGRPVSECWSEIWHVLRPLIETPFNGGPATWMEDILLEINRYGFLEESHFTIAYSPVPDETAPGGIGGVLATVHEISEKVVGERRVVALRDLSTRAVEAKTAEEACVVTAATLAKHPLDVPFALLYLIDPDGRRARLAGSASVTPGRKISPMSVELNALSGDSQEWPLSEVMRTETSQIVEDLADRFGAAVPPGPWSDPPRQAVVTPLRSNIAHQLSGLLVVGVSSRLRLDDSYLSFIELAAGQVATAVANARAYEEERRRAEALAEIDRAKTAFFSNVSHEFRTPLTLMLGPLEDMLADDELSPASCERLAVASRNSQRLLKLVNTLLDFSRIEAGRIEAVYEPVELATFTADIASVFRSAVEKAGMRLVVDCPPLPEAVYVDREMWEKIVLNLISNAFKFTFDGEIRVRLRRVGERVELEVSDTGTGIPAEETPHLFERFHRVKGARGRSYEGSGIGLALVQELVKLHGGAVRVSSEVGHGSAFTVSMPAGKAHLPADRIEAARMSVSTSLRGKVYLEEALRWLPEGDEPTEDGAETAGEPLEIEDSTSPRSAASQSPRPIVLLADDNADMREYLRRALAERGYALTAVADGESALKAARTQSFDLVLTDVMMPKLDGFGLLKALRGEERTRATPVILLSARAGEEARVEGLEAGADDYLVKPFSARELAARIESHLNLASLRREQEARTAADLKAIERLHEVGNLCARAGHNFEQCLDEIVAAAVAVTGADMGNIQLLDAESGALRIAAQRGFAEPFLNFFACVSEAEASACGVSLRSAGRVIVEDVTRSEIFAGRPSLYALLEAGVSAAQSTPLVSSSGRVFGMISTHFRRPHRPAERDLRLIDLLARQTADYLERRQADEALRARESQLQTLFDAAPLGIYVVDADFRIRQVNPTALPVFGDIPGLIGRDFDEVIHILWPKVYADEHVRRFRHTLKTGEPYIMPERIEERLDRGVKEYYEWQIHRIPLPGANPDKAYGVVCYFRDISDQVLARQKIAESEERFRALTTASSDVVYSMSPDWREIRYLNGRDFIPDTEKPSMTWLETYIHPEDQPHVTAAIQEAIRAKSVLELEHRVIRVDGTLGWTFSRAIPLLDACGEIVEWIGAASDVTVRKRSEVERAELLAREQAARAAAEDANRLKDEFLATLSHELRNPLNSIVGNAELLLLSPEANGTFQVRRAAEVIHRNAVSQAQLINDLLDLSRLQTGKMTIDKRPIALAPVVGDAVEAVRAEVAAKKLELDVALPEKSPVVNADPVRMKQIVWNLVNNAVKFTPKGGQVSVRLSQDDDGAKIVVEDTGQGIEATFLPHIFEMFRQADGGTKRSHGGMGIGLSLVSQIVELHGGNVQAFSEGQGRGARFTVKLPLHTAVGVERTAPPITTADVLADVRILVIDDSEDSLAMLHALLTGKGAKVDTALNGEEGLRLTEDMEFDLIISDISMPIMDGYEFLQKLREARPKYASVPTIALTGFGREEDTARVRQAGFTTHLTKPLDFKNLLRLAQIMLRK